MISALQEFTTCGKTWAETRATMAVTLVENYDAGHITKDNVNNLLRGLVEPVRLAAEADDEGIKARLTAVLTAGVK